jgi:integrase
MVWYVRVGKGPRVRIQEPYGTPEFMAAYHAAMAGERAPKKPGLKAGTLAWLIARYRDSAAWAMLSVATKRQRENIFLHVIKSVGEEQYSGFTRRDIAATRDAKRATPNAANNFLKTMRGLFRWALEAGFVDSDPTEGVKGSAPRTEGFHAWSEELIDRFEARWPIGTRERLALAILLYTGLRRGDAARLGRQHVRNGVILIRTEKTGVEVAIPILPELAEAIEPMPAMGLSFIATLDGRPLAKESFGNWFREACKAADVPGSAHGLRKAGATRIANNGATVAQLEAIYGWSGGKMAALYTRSADRARLAREAIGKLSKVENENIYSRRKAYPSASGPTKYGDKLRFDR